MKTVGILVALALGSAGCVSSHMKQYLGKDAIQIVIQDGAPSEVFDLPDGRRAFIYYWGGARIPVPATTTVNGEVQLVGSTAYYQEQRLSTPAGVIEREGCRIAYIAKWNPEKQGWIVSEIVYPKRAVC